MDDGDREIIEHFTKTREKTKELLRHVPDEWLTRTPDGEHYPLSHLFLHAGCGEAWWMHAVMQDGGPERKRLGRLMFSYVLGLDKWLLGKPMHFLLLDLGHIDFGFDPKNDILRVYAYLGEEETPTKEWLVACLWYHLYSSLMRWNIHKNLIERAQKAGVSLHEWMDSELGRRK